MLNKRTVRTVLWVLRSRAGRAVLRFVLARAGRMVLGRQRSKVEGQRSNVKGQRLSRPATFDLRPSTVDPKSARGAAWWAFWGAAGTIAYTYAGFPLLLALRGLLRGRDVRTQDGYTPQVSVVIAAYNEERNIVRKLENTFALEYPREQLEVIVASDGSSDATARLAIEYGADRLRVLDLPRQGKNPTLNVAVPEAEGDILVFSDADSMLEADALLRLVAPFADPEVGCVGGDFYYRAEGEEGRGERTYWDFDRALKQLQSRGGSMTSATGQIFAIRRELYTPVPSGVTDDFFLSTQAPARHLRLLFEPRAVASGPVAISEDAEYGRKVRVMTRGLNSVWSMRRLLNPLHYGFYSLQLLTHKVLRRMMWAPLAVMALSAPLLWRHGLLYRLATAGQLALHGLGLLGWLLRGTAVGRSKLLSLPFFFEMVNVASASALLNVVRGQRRDLWTTPRADR